MFDYSGGFILQNYGEKTGTHWQALLHILLACCNWPNIGDVGPLNSFYSPH